MEKIMSDGKKNRMAMLDTLSGSPAPLAMKSTSRPLRAARDAVEAVRVWELDPEQIEDTRIADRLDPNDVDDLRISIETNGQSTPILVRRHPSEDDKYLLVYGRRRLEAIRASSKVEKVQALIGSFSDEAAQRAQISENTGRRDLSYIEKALLATRLTAAEFGTQAKVAEVLNVTKSWMSMATRIVETVTPDVICAIGPAPGFGRPGWECFAKLIETEAKTTPKQLIDLAEVKRSAIKDYPESLKKNGQQIDPSVAVFETLERYLTRDRRKEKAEEAANKPGPRALSLNGTTAGSVKRSGKKVQIELVPGELADWVEDEAQWLIEQIHDFWLKNNKSKKS
jgi:ParB family chromosome partitioning protein